MNFKVDKDKCIGCGQCVSTTNEEVFAFDDDSLAKVVMAPVNEEYEEKAVAAMEGCPTEAISEEE